MKAHARLALMGVLLLSITASVRPGIAQSQQAAERCAQKGQADSLDQQIDACTVAIESGRWHGPGLAWAFNNRGNGYRMKEEYDRAIADYTDAIRIDPTYVFAFKNRGSVYQHQGDLDRAIADYSEAVRLDPAFAIAFANRASAYQEKGDFDRAIADFTTLIRLSPRDSKAFYSRGVAHQLHGDVDQALADYDQTIALDPAHFLALHNRAGVYRIKGDLDRAIADYDTAIQLHPNEATFYYNRGTAKIYEGSWREALTDFERTAALNPGSAYAALWIDILDRRNNLPSQLAAHTAQLDMSRWPAPLVRLFLGRATQDDVLTAANENEKTKTEQLCTAYFFGGQLAITQGAKDDAARLFRLSVENCAKGSVPRVDAINELKTLGVTP